MAKQISIAVVGNTTIVKEVVNGKTNIYASNTSRNYLPITGGIKIMPSNEEAILNNYVILIADLVNDGIDFTGVITSEDLVTKLAVSKAFKYGGWLGYDELVALIAANADGYLKTVSRANLVIALNGYVDLGDVSGVVNIVCSAGIHFKMNLIGAITGFTFSSFITEHLKSITLEMVSNGFTAAKPAVLVGDDWTKYDAAKTNQVQVYLLDVVTPKFSNGLLPI